MQIINSLIHKKIGGIPPLYGLVLLFCLSLALLTPYLGIYHWIGIIGLVITASILIVTFSDLHRGFYLFFFYSFFMFYLGRLLWPMEIPVGVFFDIYIVLILMAIGIKQYKGELHSRGAFNNIMGIAIIVYCAYEVLVLVNPLALSIDTSLPGIRNGFYYLSCYYIFIILLNNHKRILYFTKFWIFLSLLAALYGLFQEYVGLMDWEMRWIHRDPESFALVNQWGKIRKWSFLSDVSSFGILMSYGAIFCIVLSLGKFKNSFRVYLIIVGILMAWAMAHTGTRTATAMIPIGFVFYFMLTINHFKTVVAASIVGMAFIAILYGPFYDPTSKRIKSAFDTEDKSLEFRNYKRKLIQEWIFSHPFGTGFNTANEIAEKVSITADPDNGYLRTALDKGILGLIIQLSLYFCFFYRGIINYFRCRHKFNKNLYAAYLSAFFPVTMANFMQDAVGQKPMILIFIASFVIIEKMIFMNEEKVELKPTESYS